MRSFKSFVPRNSRAVLRVLPALAFCLAGLFVASPAQAKGQPAKLSAFAEGRLGAALQAPTPKEQRPEQRLLKAESDWGLTGGLNLGVRYALGGKGWFKDLRGEVDYQSSLRHELREIDSAGRSVTKNLRWQRLSAGVSARWSGALGPGRLGVLPGVGYRLRTLFSTVHASTINHGRHGAFLQTALAYGFWKSRIELRLAPQLEVLFADAALSRQAEGEMRMGVGGFAELAFWISGPWRVSARWEQMNGVVGDSDFQSQAASLAVGFDPTGWTK